MNDVLDAYQFLAAGLRNDPLLCLAQAVALLDPFWAETDIDEYSDDGTLTVALHICRNCLPDIYAQAVEALHRGVKYDELDALICHEVSQLGIPLDSLEGMEYGIPLPAYGATLDDPDFYTHHPELVPIVEMFGIHPDTEAYPIAVPEGVHTVGRRLFESLLEQTDERYRQVGYLLGFLCSSTGNTSADVDFDTLVEFQPLTWEPEDLAFAIEISREADEIMTAAQAGLKLLQFNPPIRSVLQDHINTLFRFFARQSKEKKRRDYPRLYWPPLDGGFTGTTETDPRILQLRRFAA
jgi:hypothetical protein